MREQASGKSKEGHATSSARIRENQRRSRTRRKEYIEHLEQRLRSFETFGVTATQEVQKAGRKVASENVLLRSLLRLHGVTEIQVEEYLELKRPSTSPIRSECPSVAILAPAKYLATVSSQPPVTYHHSPATTSHRELSNPPHDPKATGNRRSLPNSDAYGCMTVEDDSSGEKADAPNSNTVETVSESQQFRGVQDTGQFTSCVTAAGIIESVRSHSGFHDVRSELGCDSDSNCMVKNMSIFDILDKSQT